MMAQSYKDFEDLIALLRQGATRKSFDRREKIAVSTRCRLRRQASEIKKQAAR